MFDSIVLRRSENGGAVSAGQIAEALLFYHHVHLMLEQNTIVEIAKKIGLDWLLIILRRPDLSAVYCEEHLCAQSNTIGPQAYHNLTSFHVTGHNQIELDTPKKRMQFTLERSGISDRRTIKRFVKSFFELVSIRSFSGNYYIDNGISHCATNDVLNADYTKPLVKIILGDIDGGYDIQEPFDFTVLKTSNGLKISTDINFEKINRQREALGVTDTFSISNILSIFQDARADLIFASHYGGDFITSAMNSSLIRCRHKEILHRTSKNKDSLEQFHEIVLPNMPKLSEIIDSEQRTIKEFIQLLDKSSRFKYWLKTTSPDEGLIREYLKSITSESWINRLPIKTLRYLITLGADTIMPSAGLALGTADNFIIEKLLSGWRPNHFIENRLHPFHQN